VEEIVANSTVTSGMPDSRTSLQGAMGIKHTSNTFEPGRIVFSWYGINGTSGSDSWIPTRRYPDDGWDGSRSPKPIPKITDIRRPSETVFLFDGLSINVQIQNANRLNARHGKRTLTNILFFDAHAETFPTKGLPGGIGNAGVGSAAAKATFDIANLNQNYPHPKWRLDQY
jgi:prepilin-type processing-associated H-X9-DG protein